MIEETTMATIFQQANITQDENDEVSQTTSSLVLTQQLQAPLSYIMESVLSFDSNHVIYKILLENSITTITCFMLLDLDIISLLETTYNEEKLNFRISHKQNLLVAVEWVKSIIHQNPRIQQSQWMRFTQLDFQAFVAEYTLRKQQINRNGEVQEKEPKSIEVSSAISTFNKSIKLDVN